MINGFEVTPFTEVVISEQTPAPREEVIDVVRSTWNNNEEIQTLLKHVVTEIDIDRNFYDKPDEWVGIWFKGKFTIKDFQSNEPKHYEAVTLHEVVGHAFWDWAVDNKIDELVKFAKLAKESQPLTGYIKRYKDVWNDVEWTYANEQHSAMAELMNDAPSYLEYINDPSLELKQLYTVLHEDV